MRKVYNLPPFCTVVTKSRNLNFLEPSGPVMGLLFNNIKFKIRAMINLELKLNRMVIKIIGLRTPVEIVSDFRSCA